jgi:hypothetical protein
MHPLHSPKYIQLDHTTTTPTSSDDTPPTTTTTTTTTFVSHLPRCFLQRWLSFHSTRPYTKLFLAWKEWLLLLSSVRPYVGNHPVSTITTAPQNIIDPTEGQNSILCGNVPSSTTTTTYGWYVGPSSESC